MKLYKKRLPIFREKVADKWKKSKPIAIKGIKIAGVIGIGAVIYHG